MTANPKMIPSVRVSLDRWHHIVANRDFKCLQALLSERVVLRSPFLWEPYSGRDNVQEILKTVSEVFQDFSYQREIVDTYLWALEFSALVGGQPVKGIDLIELDENGQISEFEVFVRPLTGLRLLGQEMARRLVGRS